MVSVKERHCTRPTRANERNVNNTFIVAKQSKIVKRQRSAEGQSSRNRRNRHLIIPKNRVPVEFIDEHGLGIPYYS
jgi:hypothetical protein